MRIARLDLSRYGHFTDGQIEFGPGVAGSSDLHVVYGPNEAGKSTAISAILDLLFGIEARSRFHFLHDYAAMRIGASIEVDGATREFVRIKRNNGSLLDRAGRPVDEAPLLAALSGLDRGAFRDAFSMDEETLEAGGEGILASKGDLGRLLFAASAGLSTLSERLAGVRSEADGFHRARARSSDLLALKAKLMDLKRQRDEVDTAATRHAQLAAQLMEATRRYEADLAARGLSQARVAEISRQLGALPLLATSRVLRSRIRDLADLPEAPSAWKAKLPDLQVRSVEMATRLTELGGRLEHLAGEVSVITVDEVALSLAGEVTALDGMAARNSTAEADLPERRLQLRAVELAIQGMIGRLGQGKDREARDFLLDAPTTGVLRDLIESRSGIDAELRNARSEAIAAEEALGEARGAVERADPLPPGMRSGAAEAIAAVLSKVHVSDHATRARLAERKRSELVEGLDAALGELRPWSGDGDALSSMLAPTMEDVAGWKARTTVAEGRVAAAAEAVAKATADHRRLQAELDAAAAVSGLFPEQDVDAVRTERERAWAAHRRVLDHATADAFEAVLRRDDAVMAARIGHQEDLARLRLAHEGRAVAAAAALTAREALDQGTAELVAVQGEVAERLEGMAGSLRGLDLPRLEAWLARRSAALATWRSLRGVERDLAEARQDREDLRAGLWRALSIAGFAHDGSIDLEVLVECAKASLARIAKMAALGERVVEREGDLARRVRVVREAEDADRLWREAWDGTCSGCWLGEQDASRMTSEVRGILGVLEELGPATERRAALSDRIGKMESDQRAFGLAVSALATRLAWMDAADGPAKAMERLREAVAGAKSDADRLREKQDEVERLQAARLRVAEDRAVIAGQVEEMLRFFGVQTLAEVDLKLQALGRRMELVRQVEEAEQEMAMAVGASSTVEAEAILDGVDRQALEAELAEVQSRLADQDQQVREGFASLTVARRALDAIGGDDAVARLAETRRTTLVEISERALHYLRLRTGIAATEQALRLYRERHRSTMMTAASDAFSALTCGDYVRLESRPEHDGETLIAMTAKGASRTAEMLSKGTRYQLYLALRVAAFAEFARARPTLPFLVDDAFETFDDRRAERAFEALARMSTAGQVIVFTHHAHLCQIAERVCPDVRFHDLPPAPHQTASWSGTANHKNIIPAW